MSAPAKARLSKSRILAGIQCHKRLYYQISPSPLPAEFAALETSPQLQARFDQGEEVGRLAHGCFPGGVLIPLDPLAGLDAALAQTAACLDNPAVPAIFEATFQHKGVLVRIDILERLPRNRWRIIEVKSSVEPKPHYANEIAIQSHVLKSCGLDVASACLMHLNRNYVFDARQYDLRSLFVVVDLTRLVARELEPRIPRIITEQRKMLASAIPPQIEPGSQCTTPYTCEFHPLCNPPLPDHHISTVPRLSGAKREELLSQGVTLVHEIPDDYPLTPHQSRIRTAVKTSRPWIDPTGLARQLATLRYPLHFMDFETHFPAIPRFAGMRPYGHIPFQWSVHRQASPSCGADLEHFEFLAEDRRDPRVDFIESLDRAVQGRGDIIVYNASFESARLQELAAALPSRYAARIQRICRRIRDLLPVVRNHYYHPDFQGSYSLKSVLPVLDPALTYADMEVAQGDEAGLVWDRMIRDASLTSREKKRMKKALLDYCRQDTLGTARVLATLMAALVESEPANSYRKVGSLKPMSRISDCIDLTPTEPCEFYVSAGEAWSRTPDGSVGPLIRRPNAFVFEFTDPEIPEEPQSMELVLEADGLYHWRAPDGLGHWEFLAAETPTHTYLIGNTRSEDDRVGSSVFIWPKPERL